MPGAQSRRQTGVLLAHVQVASQPALKAVFEEILQAEGSEIFLVGPGDVGISTGITANFGALADRVRGKSLTAVGVVRPDGSSMLAPVSVTGTGFRVAGPRR